MPQLPDLTGTPGLVLYVSAAVVAAVASVIAWFVVKHKPPADPPS